MTVAALGVIEMACLLMVVFMFIAPEATIKVACGVIAAILLPYVLFDLARDTYCGTAGGKNTQRCAELRYEKHREEQKRR